MNIAVLMNKTRGQLQEHLRLNASASDNYVAAREVVLNYFKANQIFGLDLDAMEMGNRTRKRTTGNKGNVEGKEAGYVTRFKCGGGGHTVLQCSSQSSHGKCKEKRQRQYQGQRQRQVLRSS